MYGMLVVFVRNIAYLFWRNFPGGDVVYKRKQFGMVIWYQGSGAAMRRDLKHSKPLDPEQKTHGKNEGFKKKYMRVITCLITWKKRGFPWSELSKEKNRAGMEVSLKGIPAYTWWSIVGHLASCAKRIPMSRVFGPPCDSLNQKEDFTWIRPKSMQKTRSNHQTKNKNILLQLIPEIQPHIYRWCICIYIYVVSRKSPSWF